MFVHLYRQYLGLLVMSLVYAVWASSVRNAVLSHTLYVWTRYPSIPRGRRRAARCWQIALWAMLIFFALVVGSMFAVTTSEALPSKVAFCTVLLAPSGGILLNLGSAILFHRKATARLGDRADWQETLGADPDEARATIALADSVHLANWIWWAYVIMLPAIGTFVAVYWSTGPFVGSTPMPGQDEATMAALLAMLTSALLLATWLITINAAAPHLDLVTVGLSALRPTKDPTFPPPQSLRPGRSRTAEHGRGFRIARRLDRCVRVTERRLDPADAAVVRRAYEALAADIRRTAISSRADKDGQARYRLLVRHAIAQLAVENPVEFAHRVLTVVTEPDSDQPEAAQKRSFFASTGAAFVIFVERIDSVRKALIAAAVIVAFLWLLISGHTADFRTLR